MHLTKPAGVFIQMIGGLLAIFAVINLGPALDGSAGSWISVLIFGSMGIGLLMLGRKTNRQ